MSKTVEKIIKRKAGRNMAYQAVSPLGVLSAYFIDWIGGERAIKNMLRIDEKVKKDLIRELNKVFVGQEPREISIATHEEPHPRVLDYFKK